MIPVSKPFLAPQKEYEQIISKICITQQLTNKNSLVIDVEEKLEEYLKVSNLLFFKNREQAFDIVFKSLDLKGEVITTPFTSFSPVLLKNNTWGDCVPVFVDVEESTLNIDTKKIEASITSKTSAILASHIYGNPCDVMEIHRIAKKYNLKVIYDGTHAFDVKMYGHSIFKYGDISICSTKATKLFNELEGAFIVHNKKSDFLKSQQIRNEISSNNNLSKTILGTKTLDTEFNASMGIINLKYIHQIAEKRKTITNTYDEYLNKLDFAKPLWPKNSKSNYLCYPLIFTSEEVLLRCLHKLESYNIFVSRCFYPLVSSSISNKTNKLKVADDIGKRVLCLPLYFDLKVDEVALICAIIQYELLLFKEKLS